MKRYDLVQSSDYSIGIEPLQHGGYVRADEAAAEVSRLQSALEARTEARDKLLRVAEDNDGNNDDDEAYEMGKRVGYKQAIQDTESAEQIITDDMINAAFAALPPDAQGTMGVGEMERVLLAAFPSRRRHSQASGAIMSNSDDCPVAVKPLEWRGEFAHTNVGMLYRVEKIGTPPAPVDFVLRKVEGSCTTSSMHDDDASAHAAAQADYEQRIRAALVPVAAPVAAGSDEVAPDELTESITKTLANLGCDWRSGQPFFMDPDVKVMAILRKALASITADKAEIARLTAERDEARELLKLPYGHRFSALLERAEKAEMEAEASESRCAAVMAERDGMAEATDAKIEAVARAIYDNAAKRMKRPIAWEDAPSQRRLWAMSDARAALEAQERTA